MTEHDQIAVPPHFKSHLTQLLSVNMDDKVQACMQLNQTVNNEFNNSDQL